MATQTMSLHCKQVIYAVSVNLCSFICHKFEVCVGKICNLAAS